MRSRTHPQQPVARHAHEAAPELDGNARLRARPRPPSSGQRFWRECAVDDSAALHKETVEPEEVLAGLLAFTQCRASVRELLKHFRSLGHVVSAEPVQLEAFGLTARDVALLRLARETARLMAKAEIRRQPVIGNWQALIAYLQTTMAYEQVEQLRVLYLDCKNQLITDLVHQVGTVNHTPVYPREVLKRALVLNASALIIAHNHPSGDPQPSRSDIEVTRRLKEAAAALGIQLHDHVVIGHGTHSSFRTLGLI